MDWGAVLEALSGLLTGAGSLATGIGSWAGQNAGSLLGLGLQGLQLAPGLMGAGGQDAPIGMQAQFANLAPDDQAMRRKVLSTQQGMQGQGMSGASPDFLAAMAGVTPEELKRLMGQGFGGQ